MSPPLPFCGDPWPQQVFAYCCGRPRPLRRLRVSEEPTLTFTPRRVVCPLHGEPFRVEWPKRHLLFATCPNAGDWRAR